jgi:phosphoribosylamine--glycine ligase
MDDETAIHAVKDIYPTPESQGPLVIEEYLEGEEFSLMAFVYNEKVFPMDIARDHKRAYDNDQGPNTGGMGAYSPVPQITQAMIDEAMDNVMRPIALAMAKEGTPFQGVLYGGLMATKQGVKTIEFNVRFGDPETEVLLPRLLDPLDQVILDVMADKDVSLHFDPRFALGVVLASKGYPGTYEKNQAIKGLDQVTCPIYHMGTGRQDDTIINTGGRVVLVQEFGETLEEARRKVYTQIEKIDAPQLFYRSDIGKINP